MTVGETVGRVRIGTRAVLVAAVTLSAVGCVDDNPTDETPTTTTSSPTSSTMTTEAAPESSTAQETQQPTLLLPNMRSLPAEDIQIWQGGNGRELRFAGVLANYGPGPLVLAPDTNVECPDGQRHAAQLRYVDADGDGVFDPAIDTETKSVAAGCMVFHPSHGHWHFDSSASYVLTTQGSSRPLVSIDKVSFCMRDSRELRDAKVAAPETYGDCERDRIQGISSGWGDVYDADLDGQALPLDDIADGVYCLRLTTDPFGLLEETDEDDNSSVVAIEIAGSDVTELDNAGACAL